MPDFTLIGREPESRELRVEIRLNRLALISFTFLSGYKLLESQVVKIGGCSLVTIQGGILFSPGKYHWREVFPTKLR